jgi:hypothetical protein
MKGCTLGMREIGWMIVAVLNLAAVAVQAEVGVIQSSDGLRGTVIEFENGVQIRSDPHGQGGISLSLPEARFLLPPGAHGNRNRSTITFFGSPSPPKQIPQGPLLPFHSNHPLLSPSAPPLTPSPGTGSSGQLLRP